MTDKLTPEQLGALVVDMTKARDNLNTSGAMANLLDKALQALRQMQGENAWRPIDEIPDEGEFLVYLPEERTKIQTAKWRPNVKIIGNRFHFDCSKPTHYMPVPSPPAA